MLGIAQQRAFELSQEKVTSYVLSKGAHIGSGIHKDFVSGEDLRERPIVAQLFTKSELIESDSNMTSSFPS